ncbi:MAG TPA: hypothetical protein VGR82_00915 [Methylomirabilota bacterium]|nr:hypothetical protein [Methylomirabilota bacterium]
MRTYELYGLRLRSAFALPALPAAGSGRVDVTIARAPVARFAAARRRAGVGATPAAWFEDRALPDGGRYLRWRRLFEFAIDADGRRILARPLPGADALPRAFETYLLGQVLSFALLARGLEPLHATAVVVGDGAVGFLGDCGRGKSTLGAAFVRAGHALLTDDLLVLRGDDGRLMAAAGPPRIKLFPRVAARVLGDGFHGTPMNDRGPKLVIPLAPAPPRIALRALYVLRPGAAGRVAIASLSPRQAFVELTRNTFNDCVVDRHRLARQFALAARVAVSVPIKSLAYPRALERLAAVREAVQADLAG